MKRITGLCKYCTHSFKYYGDGKNVTQIMCVKRNGSLKHIPKQCPWFNSREVYNAKQKS